MCVMHEWELRVLSLLLLSFDLCGVGSRQIYEE